MLLQHHYGDAAEVESEAGGMLDAALASLAFGAAAAGEGGRDGVVFDPARQLAVLCEMCSRAATRQCSACGMHICSLCTRRQHWKVSAGACVCVCAPYVGFWPRVRGLQGGE